MTTTTPTALAAPAASGRFGRATRAHLANETRLLLREPAALIFGAVLPLAAIIVMTAIPAARQPLADFGGLSVVQNYAPTITLFATSVIGLTIMPGTLGGYREGGVLRRLRTTPASPATLLTALFLLMAAAGLVVAGLIVAIPAVGGAGLPTNLGWLALAAAGSLAAFLALGAVLAAVVPNPKAAAGVGNLIAALMWFAAGLWVPRFAFPDWLKAVTDLTPGGAAAQAMLEATHGLAVSWQPYAVLAAWTIVAAFIAVRTFRWE